MALITRLATAFDNPNLNTLPLDPLLPPNNLGAVRFFDPGNTLTNPNPDVSATLPAGTLQDMVTKTSYQHEEVIYNSSPQAVRKFSRLESDDNLIFTEENKGHDFLMMLWVYNGKYPDPTPVWGAPTFLRKGPGDYNTPSQSNVLFYNININQPYSKEFSNLTRANTDRYNAAGISASGVITIDSSNYGEPINGAIWRGMGLCYVYSDAFNISSDLWYNLSDQVNGTTGTANFRQGLYCRVTHVPGDFFDGATLNSNQFVAEARVSSSSDTFTTLTSANVATDGSSPYTSGYFLAEYDDRQGDPLDLITNTQGNDDVPTPHEEVALVALNWQKNTVAANSGNNQTDYTQIWQQRVRGRSASTDPGWTVFGNDPAFGAGNKGVCHTYHQQNSSPSNPTGSLVRDLMSIVPRGNTRPWYYWRFYIEDLTLSGRNAEDVYDLEWNLNSARIIAAANLIPKGDPSP